jgi:hypothetical protein
VPPVGRPTADAAKIALVATHVLAAVIIVPALVRQLRV